MIGHLAAIVGMAMLGAAMLRVIDPVLPPLVVVRGRR